jgi:hypothetical protein
LCCVSMLLTARNHTSRFLFFFSTSLKQKKSILA